MAKKIVLGLLVLMAAFTVDFLRLEVFARMDSRLSGGTTFYDSIEPAGGTLPAGMPSSVTPEDNGGIGAYPAPPASPRQKLFLPCVVRPANR
jgi:hypothetical protein